MRPNSALDPLYTGQEDRLCRTPRAFARKNTIKKKKKNYKSILPILKFLIG